ncbi:magnesium chelatase domain-containing protein [Acidithiobacillus sp. IBUN Pt1247-S3]|uniref:magnesium chelatase domain-containing protein n=1 Tax=Acidithiobacillus sp. IBUN Pt1247-S3 TaxID=3166642 RepID=UPI0034E61C2C
MALALVRSRAPLGIQAAEVMVECDLGPGLPTFAIVGLPEAAVRESRDRVRAAIQNSGLEFPARRIVVNLAPADLPKEGGRFDLPIALGILCASGQLPSHALDNLECIGELALDGSLRQVPGILACALAAAEAKHTLALPRRVGVLSRPFRASLRDRPCAANQIISPGRPGHRRTVTPSLGRGRHTRLPNDLSATMRHSTRLHSRLRGRFGGCSSPRCLPGTTRPRFALLARSDGFQPARPDWRPSVPFCLQQV